MESRLALISQVRRNYKVRTLILLLEVNLDPLNNKRRYGGFTNEGETCAHRENLA
jgi:hypothetical protein